MPLASAQVSEEMIRAGLTRQVFWGMPGWAVALWYVLVAISLVVFAWGLARPIVKYRRGGGGLPPRSELPSRLRWAVRVTLAHVTIRRRDAFAGVAHAAIFYGFVTLFIGTVILTINTDFTEPVFGWRFFQGDFYLGYSLVLDVLGVALLLGLLAMMIRRSLVRPAKLDYARPDRDSGDPQYDRRLYRIGDWVFVGALLYLVLTGYLLEAARIGADDPARQWANPIGALFVQAFGGASAGTLDVLRHVIWWSHGVAAISWVAAIPYTKAAHMFTSFASLVVRDENAGKRLVGIPEERAELPAGYGTLADFSVRHLVDLDACTKCGRCHEACPANAVGLPLSPRDVILELREEANAALSQVGIGGVLGTLLGRERPVNELDVAVVGHDRVRPETIWSCMQCNACVEACPVGIEQAPIINLMRRRLVEEGEIPSDLQKTLQTVQRSGNSFGENKRRRGAWTKDLEFEVKDARKEPVDVLWFVGDYASFDTRSQRISQNIARIYRAAGVDFGLLYDGERNAGNDVRRAGEEGLWETLATHNIGVLEQAEFNRIVTTDPHSLNTLRNEYPELGGSWQVSHHTTFLLELIESGRLDVAGKLDCRVTYHDPCYLGRHNGEYDAPRRILELLGVELVEMARNRDNSFCCGAGGGRIWIRDEPGQERPSENRIREAVGLGELDYFVVSCPKDVTMFDDAIKTSGNEERLQLREVTELIMEALDDRQLVGAGGSSTDSEGNSE